MLDLLLPRPCAGCGAVAGPWCRGCAASVPVTLLDLAVPLGPALAEAAGSADGDLRVAAATTYADTCRRLVLAFKESGRHELAPQLGDLLATAVLAAVLRAAVAGTDDAVRPLRLVPVPSRPRTRRERGADVGVLVARQAVTRLRGHGWPAGVSPLLAHRSASADQAGLTRRDRLRNLRGSLRARPGPVPDARLVLVDDIVTTGATLREAVRALAEAGHPVPLAAVVAATPVRAPAGADADTPGTPVGALPRGADPLSSGGRGR